MTNSSEKTLANILIENKLISMEDIARAQAKAQSARETLTSYLVRQGFVSENEIIKVLSRKLNLEIVDLNKFIIDQKVIKKIPVKFAWYYKFMPLAIEGKEIKIATAVPLDIKMQDEIRVYLGLQPKLVLAKESQILDVFKKYYGLAADTVDRILSKDPERVKIAEANQRQSIEDLEKASEDASIINLVNQIILEAYKKRATDIHIEPYRDKVRFRYRIDGVLMDANLPVQIRHFIFPILSRIKIMAGLSIVEKRVPQDGSAVVKTKEQNLDLRVSTIPTPSGESMVIRILPTKVRLFSLQKLGLNKENVQEFRNIIAKPHGIVFLTGPTGSGKTTTLYACLNEINTLERKIITIEDPVEYEMEGITQIQVNPKVDLNFARGLRSILRHDPDIIMVGEVRDLETAEIAIRTALTGHLVFSTLHTNDATSGITRLIDMGLEPYLVASSVEAFVAQRLVRMICPHCKEETIAPFLEIKDEIAEALKIDDNSIKFYHGKGCDQCNQTGYFGRTAIHEMMVMNEEIRSAILERPRIEYIKKIAIKSGMKTLRQDGWRKVIQGLTTPAEVINVTSKEQYPTEGIPPDDQVENKAKKENRLDNKTVYQFRTIRRNVMQSAKLDHEKRIYPRINEKVKIRYKIFQPQESDVETTTYKGDNYEHSSITKNISAGGLLFSSSHSIEVDSIVDLRIQLDEKKDGIGCLAKICRVEEDELSDTLNIAVYYLDISSADRVKIENFVNSKKDTRG